VGQLPSVLRQLKAHQGTYGMQLKAHQGTYGMQLGRRRGLTQIDNRENTAHVSKSVGYSVNVSFLFTCNTTFGLCDIIFTKNDNQII
jgi:hypothetical protein